MLMDDPRKSFFPQCDGHACDFIRLVMQYLWSLATSGQFGDSIPELSQRGRLLPKYVLHVFYPAHLAILKLLAVLLHLIQFFAEFVELLPLLLEIL